MSTATTRRSARIEAVPRPFTPLTRGVVAVGLVAVMALLPLLHTWARTDPLVIATLVGAVPLATLLVPRFERYWANLAGCLYAVGWVSLLVSVTGGYRSPFMFVYVVIAVLTALERNTRQVLVTVAASFAACFLPALYQPVPAAHLIDILLQGSFFSALAVAAHTLVTRLRASEASFRLLTENVNDVVYRYHLDEPRGYGYVSPAIERLTGYTPEEMYADPDLTTRMFSPEDLEANRSLWDDPDDEGELVVRWTRKDGRPIWVEQRFVVTRDEDGRPTVFEGIIRDVTTRMELQASLREAVDLEQATADRLREADEVKNAFLRAVSHDLRTPATSLLGYATTIRDRLDDLPREHVRMMADRMVVNGDKLRRMLTDLLDVDRLASGTVRAERTQTDLAALIGRLVDELELGDRPVSLDLDDVVAYIDAPKIERVVENLLLNAAKHTPAGTPLWVRVFEDHGGIELLVEDAGPGVPDVLKDDVFEEFNRGEPAGEGAGVGLALVARLVGLHDGRVWVDDRPGGGARFHVHLPHGDRRITAA